MTTMIKGQASKQPKGFATCFIFSKKTNQSLQLSAILDDYAGIKDRALLFGMVSTSHGAHRMSAEDTKSEVIQAPS